LNIKIVGNNGYKVNFMFMFIWKRMLPSHGTQRLGLAEAGIFDAVSDPIVM
jgi:hypothetical protein